MGTKGPNDESPKSQAITQALSDVAAYQKKNPAVQQRYVDQVKDNLTKINNENGTPEEKDQKAKSYLAEEARNDNPVASSVLRNMKLNEVSKENNLTAGQQKEVQDFDKKHNLARQRDKNEAKAVNANDESLSDLYKKSGKTFLENMKNMDAGMNAGGNTQQERMANAAYESFAQLLMMLFEALSLPTAGGMAKISNMIKEKYFESQADKFNDPKAQKSSLDSLEDNKAKLKVNYLI